MEKGIVLTKKHKKAFVSVFISQFRGENENKTLSLRHICASQPGVACMLKITDLLEIDLRELLVREYKQFYLAQEPK